jgi:KaiC/GvpD/RAD55 family RecA-like ATPase
VRKDAYEPRIISWFTSQLVKSYLKCFFPSLISEAKEQVLANLANFAYDPINYEFLRKLNVIDLFLDQLSEENTNFVQFGLGGLCNLALGNCAFVYILVVKMGL